MEPTFSPEPSPGAACLPPALAELHAQLIDQDAADSRAPAGSLRQELNLLAGLLGNFGPRLPDGTPLVPLKIGPRPSRSCAFCGQPLRE